MIESVKKLVNVGHQMSNVCYNLGQRPKEPITEHNAAIMRDLSRKWLDSLSDAVRDIEVLESRSYPMEFDPIELGC